MNNSKQIMNSIRHTRCALNEESIYLQLISELMSQIEDLDGKNDTRIVFGRYDFDKNKWDDEFEIGRLYILKFERVYEINLQKKRSGYTLSCRYMIQGHIITSFHHIDRKFVKKL